METHLKKRNHGIFVLLGRKAKVGRVLLHINVQVSFVFNRLPTPALLEVLCQNITLDVNQRFTKITNTRTVEKAKSYDPLYQ